MREFTMEGKLPDRLNASRRDFLKAGAGGTAGLLFAPSLVASGPRALGAETTGSRQSYSPSWTKDLIIYEIATKGFTSPNGPESGTFNSLKEKLPYLQELGINGIWLSGHSSAQPHYFYNIWSQYSNLEPDKIEPSLGTPEEFKSLVSEAHRHGIKILLDVHVHGVHPSSPLIKQHPNWFRKWIYDSSMVDFDWLGGHTDLDDWWVKIWTDCVARYGVDGFRLDIDLARPDLWARIRSNASALGHEIVLFEENDSVIPGLTDFSQRANPMSSANAGPDGLNQILLQDVPGFYDRKFGRAGDYQVEIQYADGIRVRGDVKDKGELGVRLDGLTVDKVGRRQADGDHVDGIADIRLTVENVVEKPIENIIVNDDRGGVWGLQPSRSARLLFFEGKAPSLQIYLATLGHGLPSVQLSCHDNGWEGFPSDKNPYVAQGSRAMFGYSFLGTPMIPIFFSGEEFDCSFRPIPWLSPTFLGDKDAGKGRWLYGNMLHWDQLNQPEHRAMFEDVKMMIAVRKREADVLGAIPDQEDPKLTAVPCEADVPVPVPYIRWNDRKAILFAANRGVNHDAQLKLKIPLEKIGMTGHSNYTITDLFPGSERRLCSESELANLTLTVKRDKTQGGGLRLFKIEPST